MKLMLFPSLLLLICDGVLTAQCRADVGLCADASARVVHQIDKQNAPRIQHNAFAVSNTILFTTMHSMPKGSSQNFFTSAQAQPTTKPGFEETLEWLNTRFAKVLGAPEVYFFEGSLYNVSFTPKTMSYCIAGKSSIQTEGDEYSDGSPRGHYIYPHVTYSFSFQKVKKISSDNSTATIKGSIRRCDVSGYRDDAPDCDDISIAYIPLKDVDGSSQSIQNALTYMSKLNGAQFVNDDMFDREVGGPLPPIILEQNTQGSGSSTHPRGQRQPYNFETHPAHSDVGPDEDAWTYTPVFKRVIALAEQRELATLKGTKANPWDEEEFPVTRLDLPTKGCIIKGESKYLSYFCEIFTDDPAKAEVEAAKLKDAFQAFGPLVAIQSFKNDKYWSQNYTLKDGVEITIAVHRELRNPSATVEINNKE